MQAHSVLVVLAFPAYHPVQPVVTVRWVRLRRLIVLLAPTVTLQVVNHATIASLAQRVNTAWVLAVRLWTVTASQDITVPSVHRQELRIQLNRAITRPRAWLHLFLAL